MCYLSNMQKTVLGLALLTFLLALPKESYASTSSVSVKNNVTSSTSTTTANSDKNISQTNIIMETNGEKQEYHGSDSNIYMESKDGNNKITINGKAAKPNTTNTPSQKPTSTPTASPQPTASSSATITLNGEVLGESTEKGKESMYEYIKNVFISFFAKFF